MTVVSKVKKDLLFATYQEYENKANTFKETNNIQMYEIFQHKLKTIRKTLTLLEINIIGINQSKWDSKGMKIKFQLPFAVVHNKKGGKKNDKL